MTDQTRGGHEARLGVASDDLVLPKRDAVDVVREWLDIARKEPIRACQVLRYPPICGSEIDAIEAILSRLASQEETIRADGSESIDLLCQWLAQSCEDDQVPKLQAQTRAFIRASRARLAAGGEG